MTRYVIVKYVIDVYLRIDTIFVLTFSKWKGVGKTLKHL